MITLIQPGTAYSVRSKNISKFGDVSDVVESCRCFSRGPRDNSGICLIRRTWNSWADSRPAILFQRAAQYIPVDRSHPASFLEDVDEIHCENFNTNQLTVLICETLWNDLGTQKSAFTWSQSQDTKPHSIQGRARCIFYLPSRTFCRFIPFLDWQLPNLPAQAHPMIYRYSIMEIHHPPKAYSGAIPRSHQNLQKELPVESGK